MTVSQLIVIQRCCDKLYHLITAHRYSQRYHSAFVVVGLPVCIENNLAFCLHAAST